MTKKIEYTKLSDLELANLCVERDLNAPVDDSGKIIRKAAYDLIRKWESNNEYLTRKDPKCRVIFHKRDSETDSPYVYICLNGRSWQMPYETEVIIPQSVLKVADNAKATVFKSRENASGAYVTVEEHIHMCPYSMLGYVTEEESQPVA